MRRIVDERWPIRYAPYMSEESKDLVSRLLERKPIKRIGCFQGRAGDIKKHPWFKVRRGKGDWCSCVSGAGRSSVGRVQSEWHAAGFSPGLRASADPAGDCHTCAAL